MSQYRDEKDGDDMADPNKRTDVTEGLAAFFTVVSQAIVEIDSEPPDSRSTEFLIARIDSLVETIVRDNPLDLEEEMLSHVQTLHRQFQRVTRGWQASS